MAPSVCQTVWSESPSPSVPRCTGNSRSPLCWDVAQGPMWSCWCHLGCSCCSRGLIPPPTQTLTSEPSAFRSLTPGFPRMPRWVKVSHIALHTCDASVKEHGICALYPCPAMLSRTVILYLRQYKVSFSPSLISSCTFTTHTSCQHARTNVRESEIHACSSFSGGSYPKRIERC